MVTVSWRLWLLTPLYPGLLLVMFLSSVDDMGTDGRRPTSKGSNLWGDWESPTLLLLRKAVSDNSAAEWNEEIDEFVSSVMDDRNGVLSDEVEELDPGDGPLPLIKVKLSDLSPLTMMVLLEADVGRAGVKLLPASSDLCIPCKFLRCFVLSPK